MSKNVLVLFSSSSLLFDFFLFFLLCLRQTKLSRKPLKLFSQQNDNNVNMDGIKKRCSSSNKITVTFF
jgi:hypothetical protein